MKLEEHICIKSLYQQPLSHKFSQMDNGEMLRRFNNELNDPTKKKILTTPLITIMDAYEP